MGLALVLLPGVLFDSHTPYPGAQALAPTLGACCIIASGCFPATGRLNTTALLAWRPLQWIGNISYSWYLWHWPILLLGRAVSGSDTLPDRIGWILLSLLLAIISSRLIESPLRNWKRWLARPGLSMVTALTAMLAACGLCTYGFNRTASHMQTPAMQRYAQAHGDAPLIYRMRCDDWYHSDQLKICEFGASDAKRTVVLLGDSHAGQWFPALDGAYDHDEWRILVITKSSCPLVDEPFFYARIGREYTECAAWRKNALEKIAAIKPDMLVMGSAQYDFTQEQWINGSNRILDALAPATGHVWILRDTPHLPFDGPDCLARQAGRPEWLKHAQPCTAPAADPGAERVYAWLQQAAMRHGNVSMLDMNPDVCPNNECSAERDGLIIYRDSQHLSGTFAASLAPAFAQKLGISTTKRE